MNIPNNPLFGSQFESQIQQLLKIDARKKTQLEDQQKNITAKKKALSDIGSKLSSLSSLLTSFKESPAENFEPLAGTSTNPDAINIISTGGLDRTGNYSISVGQLAKRDIVLSDKIASTGTDFNAAGSGSFDISVGSEDSVSINIDTSGLDNHQVLEAIAAKVNDAYGDKVQAAVYELGKGNSKLSFKSVETGEENRVQISNKQGDFNQLNLTNEFSAGELNARFTIDNITFERSSNLIDDVIDGFTFELKQTTDAVEQLNITRDTEAARKNVEDFIERFNEVNDLIRSKTYLNGETGEQGLLQSERTVRTLSYSLRQTLFMPVASAAGSGVNSLADIGIEIGQDGSMSLADSEALETALNENPQAVNQLFSAEDGIAAKLQKNVESYISEKVG
ncbi:MAG TPA: flagellar filament capping protein FliD, partial [Balneolaceae bacterium]|nr:flagellar filament capping protein FliD [Balneolaceae bacterium]